MQGRQHIATGLIALFAGFAGAALFAFSGLAPGGGGDSTREYLMANPEVLREASGELQRRDMLARLGDMRGQLETPFPGAVMGNPNGSVTLVEFSDYACGFCRQSLPDVQQLIAENPDLKVVVREYPILTPESADAARMALAAAQQGKYKVFHDAMFALGPPSPDTIEAAARQAGVDLAQARSAIESGVFDAQLQTNAMLAQQLGVTGTPSWVVGDQALSGALGVETIGAAIEAARNS
jgi:protein-disulfide isomerase